MHIYVIIVAKKIPYPSKVRLPYVRLLTVLILILIIVIISTFWVPIPYTGLTLNSILGALYFLRKLILVWGTQDNFWDYFDVWLVPGGFVKECDKWPTRHIFWRLIYFNPYSV